MDTRRLGSKNTKDINNMIFKQGQSYYGGNCKHAKVEALSSNCAIAKVKS